MNMDGEMKELVGIRRISDSSSSNARGVGGLPGAEVPSGPRLGLVLPNVASIILVDSFSWMANIHSYVCHSLTHLIEWQTYTDMCAIQYWLGNQ